MSFLRWGKIFQPHSSYRLPSSPLISHALLNVTSFDVFVNTIHASEKCFLLYSTRLLLIERKTAVLFCTFEQVANRNNNSKVWSWFNIMLSHQRMSFLTLLTFTFQSTFWKICYLMNNQKFNFLNFKLFNRVQWRSKIIRKIFNGIFGILHFVKLNQSFYSILSWLGFVCISKLPSLRQWRQVRG